MFITYYIAIVFITAIYFLFDRRKNGKSVKNSFNPHNLLFTAFVNCFWPAMLGLYVLEKTIGPYLVRPNPNDVARADSLQSVPNTPAQSNNTGANISNSPDQL